MLLLLCVAILGNAVFVPSVFTYSSGFFTAGVIMAMQTDRSIIIIAIDILRGPLLKTKSTGEFLFELLKVSFTLALPANTSVR